ncbi:TerB family tellurite resistance protein [Acidovorax sp. FHTAMBA]|jgi:hypothetical protein|uniref:TerB family tellurite resistance protein n=1 Tax=Acidovorax sp. FHTAMBA TaxID=3140252 RepID=UPI0015F43A67
MRNYPHNSPEAAARIVALVLISDGNVCRSEIDTLRDMEVEQELGIAPGAFARVVRDLCEDLLMGAHSNRSMTAYLDENMLTSMMSAISAKPLQHKVLRLAAAAAQADRHLAEAEARVMASASRQWTPEPMTVP